MGVFKRFSGKGYYIDGRKIIEKKLLYEPYARKGTTYLSKDDVAGPCYEFPKRLPEDKSQLIISEINLDNDKEKVKKITK